MAITYKILGQSAPSANVDTNLYTSTGQSVVSSITVANRSSTLTASFRVWVAVGGATTSNSQYLYYDVKIGQNDTFIATVGITMSVGDVLRVRSSTGTLSFQAFGSEII
jgi:hypothetical protein